MREVLRLRRNDVVSVFDGEGKEFGCLIEHIGGRKEPAQLIVLKEIFPPPPESDLNLTLAVALLKGEKFDLVVQKATELGAKKIIPLQTKRDDVRLRDEKETEKKLERWRRIALEAAKQSGRAALPKIEKVFEFENFVSRLNDGEARILFAERGGKSLADVNENSPKSVLAIVGAEGGWEDSEIELARENNFQIVTLGGRILRAETAAITVTALMQHLYGDLK